MTIENLHNELPDRLKAETCDTIQFFLRSNADQQMRFVIHLGGLLDFEVLIKAVRLTIYQEPIFSYTYQEDSNGAYWQKQREIDSALLVDCVEVVEDEQREIDKFITQASSPFDFPLVKIRLIRSKQKDVLCINMNHTPTDGSGLKEFARILSENYNRLLENPEYVSKPNIGGDRGIKQVTDCFTFPQKIRFTMQGLKKPKKYSSWSFNWEKANSANNDQFVTTKISSETFHRIKTFGKCNGYTVNDIVLAAFIRSFVRTRQGNEKLSKPLIIPVDLRKYIKPDHNTALCSLTGSMVINIGCEYGTSFAETLQKVVNETRYKKNIHAEMNMLFPLLATSKLMPYYKLKQQIIQRKMPPVPLVTNLGIIEADKINFGNMPVESAYIKGVVSYGDYFTMAYSTFQNEITFSIGFTGAELQTEKANQFLSDFKTELESIK